MGNLSRPKPSPDELLGELFQDVQLSRIHEDGMTFVDLVPADRLSKILRQYVREREKVGFDLSTFIQRHFSEYMTGTKEEYRTKPGVTPQEHIKELWDVLTRTAYKNSGSLIAMPYPYVVPGGRFGAQFYWDTYFIMLGLAEDGRYDLIEGMLKNYAFMIRKIGHIPTGNRTYFLSRSQPPFFAQMVKLLAKQKGKSTLAYYLPYLLAEYRFWMSGSKKLNPEMHAFRRVVQMPDGSLLNRYYDNKRNPRPESYKEDVQTAQEAEGRLASQVYLDIRAAAESGWDFSTRWFKDGKTMATIHTTDIIPVDLNCLLYDLECTIAETYSFLRQQRLAQRFKEKAEQRAQAIQKYFWSEEKGFFFDYDFVAGEQKQVETLAAVFPLYIPIATQEQSGRVAEKLVNDFLKPGGLVTTCIDSGQQWDSPNGWAPLQWVAIQGLREYHLDELATQIKNRWVETTLALYNHEAKMVEKYNVVNMNMLGGGGEYALQDGFGWTNGVLLALLNES